MLNCLNCQSQLVGKYSLKFCNRSCAASYNNRQKIKHGKFQERPCTVCNKTYLPHTADSKFCSKACFGNSIRKYKTAEEKLLAKRKGWCEHNANYRAKLLEQTPLDADREAIKEFYLNCPPGYDVDHIIPISKGGLHTLSNLQYLTASENRSKGNKLNWPVRRDSNSQPLV
jgi:5-methylcytosine-specific restriction endonuclease McrA